VKNAKHIWTKPELTKLGTLKDVAGGKLLGVEAGGKGNGKKAIS